MSNFKIGNTVKVKKSGLTGVIGNRNVENNDNTVKVTYLVKTTQDGKWGWYSRKELEKVYANPTNHGNQRVYPKEYSTTRALADGRHILVIGIVDTYYHEFVKDVPTKLDTNIKSIKDAMLLTYQRTKKKRLRLAWAITHPSDDFNFEKGLAIARTRCYDRPMSVLESDYVGEFREDLVTAILNVKADFIENNISKFTANKR